MFSSGKSAYAEWEWNVESELDAEYGDAYEMKLFLLYYDSSKGLWEMSDKKILEAIIIIKELFNDIYIAVKQAYEEDDEIAMQDVGDEYEEELNIIGGFDDIWDLEKTIKSLHKRLDAILPNIKRIKKEVGRQIVEECFET